MKGEHAMDDSTEAPICATCRRIPLSHLSLDVDEPLVGWEAFFEERYITVMDDSLRRPSVARHVLGDLLAEQRAHETRLAEEAAQKAADDSPSRQWSRPGKRRAIRVDDRGWQRVAGGGVRSVGEAALPPGGAQKGAKRQAAEREAVRRRKEAK
jgi:hypothetical protein